MELAAREIDLEGTSLTVHVRPGPAGSDPPVVFLHCWFGCWLYYSRAIAGLPELPCYAVDLYSPGRGEWRRYSGPAGLAEAVVALLEAEGIDRCTLVGNSMGGIAAQVVAMTAPERVERLVLVGTGAAPAGLRPDYRAELDAWIESDPDGSRTEALVLRLLARRPPPDELAGYVAEVRAANRDFMVATLESALGIDLRPRLPGIAARTLVMRGDLDVARTQEHVDDLLRGISGSSAVEIAGGGHAAMVDCPEEFTRLLREWLGLDGAASRSVGR